MYKIGQNIVYERRTSRWLSRGRVELLREFEYSRTTGIFIGMSTRFGRVRALARDFHQFITGVSGSGSPRIVRIVSKNKKPLKNRVRARRKHREI